MHIPDNYLSPSTCAVFGAAMFPVWRRAVNKVKSEITREKLPLLAVGAAFSFLIMMFNLPLPGGTTGHAVGAALIAILLGPYSAVISISVALIIQALFFGDGGILAIGVNTFNMAFVMPFTAYYIYNLIKKSGIKSEYIATFGAGYISLNAAALFTAVEFGIQPYLFRDASNMPVYCPYPLSVSIPAMMIPHLLVVGIVEGAVTALVYAYVKKLSPEVIYKNESYNAKPLYGLIAAMAVLSPLGLLASGTAWGEWGAKEIKEVAGYIPHAIEKGFGFNAIMPDYAVPGLSEVSGYIMSAGAGILIIFVIFRLLKLRRPDAAKK